MLVRFQLIDITCYFFKIFVAAPVSPDCFIPAVQDFPADAEDEFMERLPELSGLSHADKDQLIRLLWESLGELREELSELRAAVSTA